jgi:hypothetical protein
MMHVPAITTVNTMTLLRLLLGVQCAMSGVCFVKDTVQQQ